jgi:hypothetical protein
MNPKVTMCRDTKQGEITMNTPNEYQDDNGNSAYNPFPEPQTIPSGWDMSEFIAISQVDSLTDEDNAADSQR